MAAQWASGSCHTPRAFRPPSIKCDQACAPVPYISPHSKSTTTTVCVCLELWYQKPAHYNQNPDSSIRKTLFQSNRCSQDKEKKSFGCCGAAAWRQPCAGVVTCGRYMSTVLNSQTQYRKCLMMVETLLTGNVMLVARTPQNLRHLWHFFIILDGPLLWWKSCFIICMQTWPKRVVST